MSDRYVLLGLARPRSRWFADVGRWATAAAIPADFVRCVSVEEMHRRAAGGRRFSAALLDGGLPGVDRDLLAALRQAGIVPIVVSDEARDLDWHGLGAAAVLTSLPTRAELLDALATHASMIDHLQPKPLASDAPVGWDRPGRLIAVTGPGGVGTSTTAMATAQGLAAQRQPDRPERVLLADLCLQAELAMLHDARDIAPGFPEVAELHRGEAPTPGRLRPLAFEAVERGYDLLLGLRRAADWTLLRPHAVQAAIEGLRRAWDVVVVDIDPTFEGEHETGSTDLEERHAMARHAALAADLTLVVGRPSIKWVHALVRVLDDLGRLGVDPARIQPVVLDGPRNPRQRADLTRSVADLVSARIRADLAAPVFLGSRGVDAAIRDGAPLPAAICRSIAAAVSAGLERGTSPELTLPIPSPEPEPIAVVPGELGLADDGEMFA